MTGDSTVAGPGENRFLQCVVFVLSSGRESEESPGIASGLLFLKDLTGLVLPKTLVDSIFSCPICINPAGGRSFVVDLFSWNFESDSANWLARRSKLQANREANQLA